MLPASAAHISTSGHRVLAPESRIPALASKDRYRATLEKSRNSEVITAQTV